MQLALQVVMDGLLLAGAAQGEARQECARSTEMNKETR